MTYREFKEECAKTEPGRIVFGLWMGMRVPLTQAMGLLEICRELDKTEILITRLQERQSECYNIGIT